MSSALVVERHPDADAFLARAQSWLLEAEAENNLLLGLALARRGEPKADPPIYWASVHDASRIVACACRTPPHPLVLSRIPAAAIPSLANDVADVYPVLTGVNGPTSSAEAFADTWIAAHGGSWNARFRMRLHELTRVSLTDPLASGALRKATHAEMALAREWMDAFARDVGTPHTGADIAERIARGQVFFWIDGGLATAMVSWSRETRAGCAINTVYTPPQLRGRGYATAAVAKLGEALLADGRRFCCLYTDLAKPAPNAVYAKVGFRPLRDDTQIEFVV